jgi:TraB/PrgY/gumN family
MGGSCRRRQRQRRRTRQSHPVLADNGGMFKRPGLLTRLSAAVPIACLVAVAATAQTRANSFLWKVQSGANVMYLAGSVHALTADAYPLNPVYQRAFDASGALVEEIDLAEADPLSGGLGLLAKGMYSRPLRWSLNG